MGMLGVFLGMRGRLKKKVLPPELVQEACFEVVGIQFHPQERFGHPASNNVRPHAAHECWQIGWVRCDYLPLHIEIRVDGESEDYTGLGKPGIWHLEPTKDDWQLPIRKSFTIDHPNALRAKHVQVTAKKAKDVDVSRTQVPMAPEFPVTFQGIQGTTIRGPEGQPKGLVLDLMRPQTMQGPEREPEYFQHLYMALGRARKLKWMLLRNFPRDEAGELAWHIFENGPPDFLVEFMQILASKAKHTWPKLEKAQRELGMPAWDDVPDCLPDPSRKGRFLYDAAQWSKQATKSCQDSPSKRLFGKRASQRPVTLQHDLKDPRSPAKRRTCTVTLDRTPDAATESPKRARTEDKGRGCSKGSKAFQHDRPPKTPTGKSLKLVPGLRRSTSRGWWCSLLGKAIGMLGPQQSEMENFIFQLCFPSVGGSN